MIEQTSMNPRGISVVGGEARVVEILEHEVSERGLGPGSKLPTERDLAELSGEARTTVRRALNTLEAEGKVVRHVGRGTFLAAPTSSRGDAQMADASPAEIMAARLLIEPQMAPLIVASGTPGDFEEMKRCLEGGDAAGNWHEFSMWGSALHSALADATHNRMLIQINEMYELHDRPLWSSLLKRSYSADRIAGYRKDHHAIVEALVERDARTAQKVMREHIARIRRNVFGEHL